VDPQKVQEVWDEFDSLMEMVRKVPPEDSPGFTSPEQFRTAAKAWAAKYKQETFRDDMIPYIHGKSMY
jgi:hypothetical protein